MSLNRLAIIHNLHPIISTFGISGKELGEIRIADALVHRQGAPTEAYH